MDLIFGRLVVRKKVLLVDRSKVRVIKMIRDLLLIDYLFTLVRFDLVLLEFLAILGRR